MAISLETIRKEIYINGNWRPAQDGFRFDVIDPANESVLASVADATVEDALAAVDAAHTAGPAWAPISMGNTRRVVGTWARAEANRVCTT